MGKFFDALQKRKAFLDLSTTAEVKPQRRPSQRDTSSSPAEMPKSLRLESETCQLAAIHELLICGNQAGNMKKEFAAEQYRMLCSQLLFTPAGQMPKTILVTSAIPSEGKSIVASNLATTIALRKKEYALLIECDLRRPSLGRIFGIGHCRGLSDYLSEEGELRKYLYKTDVDKLTLLPGGSRSRDPYKLLTSDRMVKLLEEARNRYEDRYIIVDSTPAQVAAETTVLSRYVDGVILVIRYGKTSRKLIQEIVERIGKDKILGVVFNAFEGQYTRSYYYHYYGVSDSKIKKYIGKLIKK